MEVKILKDVCIPLLIGVVATLISSLSMALVQYMLQTFEEERELSKLTYQAAIEEWKTLVEIADKHNQNIPVFSDILLDHINYSYVVRKYGADEESEKFAGQNLDVMLEQYRMRALARRALDSLDSEENDKEFQKQTLEGDETNRRNDANHPGPSPKEKPHNQEAQSSKDNAASQHEKQQCANLKQGHQSRLCPTLIGLAPGSQARWLLLR